MIEKEARKEEKKIVNKGSSVKEVLITVGKVVGAGVSLIVLTLYLPSLIGKVVEKMSGDSKLAGNVSEDSKLENKVSCSNKLVEKVGNNSKPRCLQDEEGFEQHDGLYYKEKDGFYYVSDSAEHGQKAYVSMRFSTENKQINPVAINLHMNMLLESYMLKCKDELKQDKTQISITQKQEDVYFDFMGEADNIKKHITNIFENKRIDKDTYDSVKRNVISRLEKMRSSQTEDFKVKQACSDAVHGFTPMKEQMEKLIKDMDAEKAMELNFSGELHLQTMCCGYAEYNTFKTLHDELKGEYSAKEPVFNNLKSKTEIKVKTCGPELFQVAYIVPKEYDARCRFLVHLLLRESNEKVTKNDPYVSYRYDRRGVPFLIFKSQTDQSMEVMRKNVYTFIKKRIPEILEEVTDEELDSYKKLIFDEHLPGDHSTFNKLAIHAILTWEYDGFNFKRNVEVSDGSASLKKDEITSFPLGDFINLEVVTSP